MPPDLGARYARWVWCRALLHRGWWLVTSLYLVVDAHLTAAQLVLIGVAQAAVGLVFEVPTGVVADTLSRKWSLVVSHLLMGTAMAATGLVRGFLPLLATQMLWGLSWTFASGADVAWISDELDEPVAAGPSRLRGDDRLRAGDRGHRRPRRNGCGAGHVRRAAGRRDRRGGFRVTLALTFSHIGKYGGRMARAATTSDAFNAIAEPQRRDILALLRAGECPVTDLAQQLGMSLPGASKHLRVLHEVGLVRVRRAGKQRLYGLDARGLRPVHEWAGGFEQFWNESFDRLDAYVQDLKQNRREP